jgi:dimeric dUTPase (all-alpha-NTP-PPase superfamily)
MLLRKDRKEELFAQGEFKSKAERSRVTKANEIEKAEELNAIIKGYTDFLAVGEKLILGNIQIEKKLKDGVEVIKVKYSEPKIK